MGCLFLLKFMRRSFLSAAIAVSLIWQQAEAKFPLTVFKGVTNCLSDTKKYLSPTLGIAALESGVIFNIRLYGNFDAAYRQTTAGPEREYANDQSNDPVWQLTRILFPSTAGQLSGDSSHRFNFGKHIKTPKTIALLINFTDDVRSGKTIDEERLKNDIITTMGYNFKEKMSQGEKVKKAFYSLQNDRKLAKEITIIASLAVKEYGHKNVQSQRRLGEAKNDLLQIITRKIKKIEDTTIQSIFMDTVRKLYQLEPKNQPGRKSLPVKPRFFRTALWHIKLAFEEATRILETTKIQDRIGQIDKREPKQTFLRGFKEETLTPLLEAIKKAILTPPPEGEAFYPKYTPEQVILAFFAYKFSTREDIKTFLTHLKPNLINSHHLSLFDVSDLLTPDELTQIAEKKVHTLDDILALSTADIWTMPTPYRGGSSILSNSNTLKYDRKNDSYAPATFIDCVETSIRHMVNCFLYDPLSRQFNFNGLTNYHAINPLSSAQKVFFAALTSFYQRQSVELANDGRIEMGYQWNRVVGDLNMPDEPLETKIRYRKETNELDAGFINLMKVFHKVLGIRLTPTPEENAHLNDKKKWLDGAFKEVFKALNPHKGYSIHINMDEVTSKNAEILGYITISVYNEQGVMLYSFDFSSKPNRHGELENYRVGDHFTEINYLSELKNSSFQGNGAENVIWLLSKSPQIESLKNLPTFYQWFNASLSDNEAKTLFLTKIGHSYISNKLSIPHHELRRVLKNIIRDLNLENVTTIKQTASTLLNLLKNEEINGFIKEGLKATKFASWYLSRDKEMTNLILEALMLNNKNIISLELAQNCIDNNGLRFLAQALIKNTTLKSLSLKNNFIGHNEISALSHALIKNTSLTFLSLEDTSINDDGAIALAQTLTKNTTLTFLDLSFNGIKDAGAISLAQALVKNTSLTSLSIMNNFINNGGAIAFGQALLNNKTLTELNLDSNSIKGAGAVTLAQALLSNTTLTSLHLSLNDIKGVGAMAFAQTLIKNTTLRSLSLGSDDLKDADVIGLASTLTSNTTLKYLWIKSSEIDYGTKNEINRMSNGRLKFLE